MLLELINVLSLCRVQAHAHPLVNTAYFPSRNPSIQGATGAELAFVSDKQTQPLSKWFLFSMCESNSL